MVRAGGQDVAARRRPSPTGPRSAGSWRWGTAGTAASGSGPVRDAVLEVTAVSARGELIRSGAPLVKNVTGFDLCRLLVGSLGTLALLGEVVLRCRPRARGGDAGGWRTGPTRSQLADRLYRPLSVLWDGTRTWVGLAGYQADVRGQAEAVLGTVVRARRRHRRQAVPGAVTPVAGPPAQPLRALAAEEAGRRGGGWLAEVGVGVVHCTPEVAARLAPGAAPASTAWSNCTGP